MDIDFHYFATYAAARFAGYGASDALKVATSAQMIDENARHTLKSKVERSFLRMGIMGLPDDFSIRHSAKGPTIHTYRVQQTFQGMEDIGTAGHSSLSSIWPVYHFMPGNFATTRRGQERFSSKRWLPRMYTADAPSAETKRRFEWLCRPHSPMAIALVNNCRELVNDPRSVIARHNLGAYLAGVSMHVFVDTWAHQDFVGMASKSINNIATGDLKYRFVTSRALPELKGSREPMEVFKLDMSLSQEKSGSWGEQTPNIQAHENGAVYVGHGRAGHLPDHSSLVWTYKPAWSGAYITRYNPIIYLDAFVHMVRALYCIRTNTTYEPFDLDGDIFRHIPSEFGFNQTNLKTIYELIRFERSQLGDKTANDSKLENAWDNAIYAYGSNWIEALNRLFPGNEPKPTSWLPGNSGWVSDAAFQLHANYEENKGYWYTPSQLMSLDFFKFNIAAKFHYRFVKQQLLAFNKLLIGDWQDGAAYSDDLDRLDSAQSQGDLIKSEILTTLSSLQRTEKVRELNEGITVLINDIQAAPTSDEAKAILRRVVSTVDSAKKLNTQEKSGLWTYGLLKPNGSVVSNSALSTIKQLAAGGDASLDAGFSTSISSCVQRALDKYAEQSKGFFTSQSEDSKQAASVLRGMLDSNAPNSEDDLTGTVSYLLGRNASKPPTVTRPIKPLKVGSRFHTILSEEIRKA